MNGIRIEYQNILFVFEIHSIIGLAGGHYTTLLKKNNKFFYVNISSFKNECKMNLNYFKRKCTNKDNFYIFRLEHIIDLQSTSQNKVSINQTFDPKLSIPSVISPESENLNSKIGLINEIIKLNSTNMKYERKNFIKFNISDLEKMYEALIKQSKKGSSKYINIPNHGRRKTYKKMVVHI